MDIPGFDAAVAILIAVWAILGVIRDTKGTTDAARWAYTTTYISLRGSSAQEPGKVGGGDVLGEVFAGAIAGAAGFGAAIGWATGQDLYKAVIRRRTSAAGDESQNTESGDPKTPDTGATAAPGSATGPDQPADAAGRPWRPFTSYFGFNRRGARGQQAEPEVIEGELVDDELPTTTSAPVFHAELGAADPSGARWAPPGPTTILIEPFPQDPPKENPHPMSELASPIGSTSLSPSATLSRAKSDLAAARDAAAALATALARQIQIAAARSQTAATRATELESLAQQAAAAAANARVSIETAAANRVDAASLNAMAAVVQKLGALANQAGAGAQLARQLATGEADLATVLNQIGTEARGVAEAANAARDTLARHQDPHQQAVGATGHEGASADYLVG